MSAYHEGSWGFFGTCVLCCENVESVVCFVTLKPLFLTE